MYLNVVSIVLCLFSTRIHALCQVHMLTKPDIEIVRREILSWALCREGTRKKLREGVFVLGIFSPKACHIPGRCRLLPLGGHYVLLC